MQGASLRWCPRQLPGTSERGQCRSDEPAPAVELHPAVANCSTRSPTLRCLDEDVKALAGNGHLREQHALGDAVEDVPCPRLQLSVFKRMVEVVTPQPPAEHHTETITRRRSLNLSERRPRRGIGRRRGAARDRNGPLAVRPRPTITRDRFENATSLTPPPVSLLSTRRRTEPRNPPRTDPDNLTTLFAPHALHSTKTLRLRPLEQQRFSIVTSWGTSTK